MKDKQIGGLNHERYLIYNNIVRGAGVGHTLSCYNYAIQLALQEKLQLIVPRTHLGHEAGSNFQFENFFGLDCYTPEQIQDFVTITPKEDIVVVEYSTEKNPSNSYYTKTKDFFLNRYLKAYPLLKEKYKNHIVPGKINIAMHIRRGDIVANKNYLEHHKYRILSDKWWRDSFDKILISKKYDLSDIHLNIYSELGKNGLYYNEKAEQFDLKKVFDFKNCSFYLSVNIYECIYNIINADIFLGGRWGLPLTITPYREWQSRETFIEKIHANYIKCNNFVNTKVIPN
jgi:hypothetical protein